MRTFSRSDWDAAQAAWTDGEFSDEWRDVRHVMAMQGAIFPPNGDRHDSWEDASPSQRAILIRAIRETPSLLRLSLVHATSWSMVIERLLRRRDEWREELADREREAARQRAEEHIPHRESAMSVRDILRRLADQ